MDLRAAAGTAPEHVASPPSDIEAATPVRVGDIRVVEPLPGAEAEPRMALVVRAYSGPVDVAEVLLAHTCVEMATPNDAVLDPDNTGLPHSLVVQTRLRGPVWQPQLTQPLGRLPQTHMAAIAQIYSLDGTPPKVRTGSRDPLKMPPRIPAARDLTLYAERRLITAPFLWQVSGNHLLEQACGGEDPHDSCYEVYLLAPRVTCTSPLN